jgi:cell wall-associated NlpC family hydrolase
MPTGADVLLHARRLIGYHYKFGGELDPTGPAGDADCSELVEWSVAQAGIEDGTGVRITDGSWRQYQACRHIPVEQALATTGALVFLSRSDPPREGRDGIYHVGVVDAGRGQVMEACCGDGDRIQPSGIGRRHWYRIGGLIPGIDYTQEDDDVSAAEVWQYGMSDWTGENKTKTAAETLAQARYDAWDAVRRIKALEERLERLEPQQDDGR